MEINDNKYLHDIESYVITIKRKGQAGSMEEPAIKAYTCKNAVSPEEAVQEGGRIHEPAGRQESAECQKPMDHQGSSIIKTITAPLPGIIVGIQAKAGEQIREGQELAVLEAMKMENSIESPCNGIVREISVSVGDTVSEGTVILTIE